MSRVPTFAETDSRSEELGQRAEGRQRSWCSADWQARAYLLESSNEGERPASRDLCKRRRQIISEMEEIDATIERIPQNPQNLEGTVTSDHLQRSSALQLKAQEALQLQRK